jgi:hypothetical protein
VTGREAGFATNCVRLEKLRHGRSQVEKGEPHKHQQQEVAVDGMGEPEDDDGEPREGSRETSGVSTAGKSPAASSTTLGVTAAV